MTEPKKLTAEELVVLQARFSDPTMGLERGYYRDIVLTGRSLLAHIAALEQELAAVDATHNPIEELAELDRIGLHSTAEAIRRYIRDLEQDCNAGASMLAKLHDRYNALGAKSQQRKEALTRALDEWQPNEFGRRQCCGVIYPNRHGKHCWLQLVLED